MEMVRALVKASGESLDAGENVVTRWLRIRLSSELQTGAWRTPATESQSESDSVAASEEERTLHG
ncbi:hypothetical protein GCM10023114_23520 [Mycolicibacterium sediminis]|uniref:Uncharacterized protein n=1 Tax=Mycolicibacterium sediminis TaxID=1286180 RepID=A0A7I7QJB1_9MYCO|nr:hypothetical protein MSEDJ_04990 [Mycolicibacterium sediminis]